MTAPPYPSRTRRCRVAPSLHLCARRTTARLATPHNHLDPPSRLVDATRDHQSPHLAAHRFADQTAANDACCTPLDSGTSPTTPATSSHLASRSIRRSTPAVANPGTSVFQRLQPRTCAITSPSPAPTDR